MSKLLIITGPQGSGNHLFSRLFSFHPDVKGWDDLQDEYWIPSDKEPFAEAWIDPESLTRPDFGTYTVANVSVPFVYDGEMRIPNIQGVINRARELGIQTVRVGIIVREPTINKLQQMRVRGLETIHMADSIYSTIYDAQIDFIDHEAFFLYKRRYLRWLQGMLGFPIAWDHPDLMKFLDTEPNAKYITPVKEYWLDEQVHAGCKPFKDRTD